MLSLPPSLAGEAGNRPFLFALPLPPPILLFPCMIVCVILYIHNIYVYISYICLCIIYNIYYYICYHCCCCVLCPPPRKKAGGCGRHPPPSFSAGHPSMVDCRVPFTFALTVLTRVAWDPIPPQNMRWGKNPKQVEMAQNVLDASFGFFENLGCS